MRISWDNYAQIGATISGSPSAATGYAFGNLARAERSLTYRSASPATAFDASTTWTGNLPVSAVALFGLPAGLGNAGPLYVNIFTWNGAAWNLVAESTFAADVSNNSAFARFGNWESRTLLWRPAAAVTAQGVKIVLSVTSAITWTASRLWIGNTWTPARGIAYTSTFGMNDTSERVRAADGSLRTIEGPKYRTMSVTFPALSDQEHSDLDYWHRVAARDALLLPFAGEGSQREANETWIGRLVSPVSRTARPVWLPSGTISATAATLEFEEI